MKDAAIPTWTVTDGGDIVCTCGNTPSESGFDCCDETRRIVEPNPPWNGLWVCLDCRRVGRYPTDNDTPTTA